MSRADVVARRSALRAERRAAGQCTYCGGTPKPDHLQCAACIAKQATYYPDRNAARSARKVVARERINASALRTCPTCGMRDIVTIAAYGDDRLPSCAPCAVEEEPAGYPVEMSLAERAVLIARTCPGMTSRQIADEMGLPYGERGAVTVALGRAVRAGVLKHNGARDSEERRYVRTSASWRSAETVEIPCVGNHGGTL